MTKTYHITAIKTQLYQLVKDFSAVPVPKMKQTKFSKAYRSQNCWLEFDGYRCYFSACCGRALLAISYMGGRRTVTIPLDELNARGMIKEVCAADK